MNKIKEKIHVDKFSIREVIILVIVTAIVSLATGFAITTRIMEEIKKDDSKIENANLQSFIDNYNYILDNYYGEYDEQKVLDSALKGVLTALGDPHTAYLDETQVNNFDIQLEGNYNGFGIKITNTGESFEIVQIFNDSPAEKAGLKVGDKILKIDNDSVLDLTTQEFSKIVRNSNQKKFKLMIQRNDENLEIELVRDNVTISSVNSKIIKDDNLKIGYLNISIFANNTYSQVKDQLQKLELENINSLILDVRDNTGGHLTSVENILSLFLDSTHVIYQTQNNEITEKCYSNGSKTKEYPIIVLTNENSASASEILTIALKEEYGAKSLGKKTYGKGSAQELRTLPDGTKYKFTTKKWLSPKGNSIDKVGIDVDYDITLSDKFLNNPTEDNDNQLQLAIKYLIN